MSTAGHPWRERRVVDGLAGALREAAAERVLGSGAATAPKTAAPAMASPGPERGPDSGAK
ncbi:hypothetical protein [Streptomyces sp. NPDC091371]|uniref:hypothetical protein n=1 Tax=Streptomyces sp. NPDC091371 TaxID=3155303 RepID=UPI0034212AD9